MYCIPEETWFSHCMWVLSQLLSFSWALENEKKILKGAFQGWVGQRRGAGREGDEEKLCGLVSVANSHLSESILVGMTPSNRQ